MMVAYAISRANLVVATGPTRPMSCVCTSKLLVASTSERALSSCVGGRAAVFYAAACLTRALRELDLPRALCREGARNNKQHQHE